MKITLQDFRPPSSWFHITVYPTLTSSHHVSSSPYTTYQTPITPHNLPPSPPHSHPAITCFFIALYNISNSHHSTSPPTITPTLTSSHHMFLHRLIQHIPAAVPNIAPCWFCSYHPTDTSRHHSGCCTGHLPIGLLRLARCERDRGRGWGRGRCRHRS